MKKPIGSSLTEQLQAMVARAVHAETALREALTALRIGRNAEARELLEKHERERERRDGHSSSTG